MAGLVDNIRWLKQAPVARRAFAIKTLQNRKRCRHLASGVPAPGRQRFESPPLHQEVRTSDGSFPAPKINRRYSPPRQAAALGPACLP
jgi:hypothetical protein